MLCLSLIVVSLALVSCDLYGPSKPLDLQAGKLKFSVQWAKFSREVQGEHILSNTPEEMKQRHRNFNRAKKQMVKKNASPRTDFVSSINKFSFMSEAEKGSFKGLNVTRVMQKREAGDRVEVAKRDNQASHSWWSDYLTDIKDQSTCGSCWSYAALCVLETKQKIAGGALVQMSEQEIIDCNSAGEECAGGWYTTAWAYVQNKGRIASSADYPYQNAKGTCYSGYKSSVLEVSVSSYVTMAGTASESNLANSIVSGPVAIAINADDTFMAYDSGTFNLCRDSSVNHAVVAVGYDSSRFLVRNSWGTSWGTVGYVYMARNVCSSLTYNYYAATLSVSSKKVKREVEQIE